MTHRGGFGAGIAIGCGAAAALGCGGLWREAMCDDYADTVVVVESTAAPDARTDEVLDLLHASFAATWEGECGLWTLSRVDTEIEKALGDGAFTDGEVALLREVASACTSAKIPADRRTELARIEAELVERARARGVDAPAPDVVEDGDIDEVGVTDGDGDTPNAGNDGDEIRQTPVEADARSGTRRTSLDGWALPDDLAAAAARAGWTVTCRAEGAQAASCAGDADDVHATLTVERFATAAEAARIGPDGEGTAIRHGETTVLEVTISDGDGAADLRDAIAGVRGSVADLDATALETASASVGWRTERCRTVRADDGTDTRCGASREGQSARLEHHRAASTGAGDTVRTLRDGIATVDQGGSVLVVQVEDRRAAESLADALVR